MAITWADVTAIAAGMSAVASGTQTAILAHVNEVMNVTEWGYRYTMGGALLGAHYGALALANSASGARGPVTAEAIGDASKSYAVPALDMSAGALGATVYGAQYFALLKQLPCAFGMVL